MILSFSVGGFLSFNSEQTIFFTPYSGARLRNTKYEDNFHLNKANRPMKSLLLFGDNASGKTNWFYGLSKFKDIIKNGLGDVSSEIFNKHSEIISFEISVLDVEDNSFEYVLAFNRDGFIEYERLTKNDDEIFEFMNNKLKIVEKSDDVEDIKSLEKLFSKSSSNTLLLKLKDVLQTPIDGFFSSVDSLKIDGESFFNREVKWVPVDLFTEKTKIEMEDLKTDVLSILISLDKTIVDFKFIEKIINDKAGIGFEMVLVRKNGDEYELSSESLGIKKIVRLLPSMLRIYDGESIFIDELDSSIGTKALISLFNSFINSKNNLSGQIVVSTHNLALLDLDMFHDSQIYLLNKGNGLSTVIHSLDEFDFRSDKRKLDELYMKGSFEVDE
ncbi:MAG: ATP-binding protein [Bacillota bacterium]|nr:ATP-binding protein [Bacillota bacterium]